MTISTLPHNISDTLLQKCKQFANSEMTDNELYENIKLFNLKDLILFVDCCAHDSTYSKAHENLLKKLWKHIDKSFDTTLSGRQQKKVLSIIFNNSEAVQGFLPQNLTVDLKDKSLEISRLLFIKNQYVQTSLHFSQKKDILDLKKTNSEVFEIIKQFMATGQLPRIESEEIGTQLYENALEFNLKDLIKAFPSHAVITPKNATYYFTFSLIHKDYPLRNAALNCLRSSISSVEEAKALYEFAMESEKESKNVDDYESIKEISLNFLKELVFNNLQIISTDAEILKAIESHKIKVKKKDLIHDKEILLTNPKTREAFDQIRQAESVLQQSGGLVHRGDNLFQKLSPQRLMVLMKFFPDLIQQLSFQEHTTEDIASLVKFLVTIQVIPFAPQT